MDLISNETKCEKEEIPKCVPRRYRQRIRMKLKKSFIKILWTSYWNPIILLVTSWV